MRPILYIAMFCFLMGPTWLWAQKDEGGFFSRMGHADGVYEQTVHFSAEPDELDYWNDQRAFEQALLSQKPEAFRHYLDAKHEVYAAHRPLCGSTCKHGDYYWLQASYYIQFGPDAAAEYTSAGGIVPTATKQ